MCTEGLEQSLIDTLQDSDLSALEADLGEVALDALLEDGAIKDLPVIGTLQKVYNVCASVHNWLFMRKLLRFLRGMARIPAEERRKQIARLIVDTKERQRVGENLLLLLDRLNNMQKPEMAARVFRAFLEERITSEQCESLTHAIDVLNMADMGVLRDFYRNAPIELGPDGRRRSKPSYTPMCAKPLYEEYNPLQALAVCGLLAFSFGTRQEHETSPDGRIILASTMRGGIAYRPNELGRLFVEVVLDERIQDHER